LKNSADKLDNENMNASTQLAVWRDGGSDPEEKTICVLSSKFSVSRRDVVRKRATAYRATRR